MIGNPYQRFGVKSFDPSKRIGSLVGNQIVYCRQPGRGDAVEIANLHRGHAMRRNPQILAAVTGGENQNFDLAAPDPCHRSRDRVRRYVLPRIGVFAQASGCRCPILVSEITGYVKPRAVVAGKNGFEKPGGDPFAQILRQIANPQPAIGPWRRRSDHLVGWCIRDQPPAPILF